VGPKFPVFPVETGNFVDFPDATAVWPRGIARQINILPANSRSSTNREFGLAQSGIKLAEPGIICGNVRASASSRDDRAPKENQQETHLSVPSKCHKT
jgi:hypothetical protein